MQRVAEVALKALASQQDWPLLSDSVRPGSIGMQDGGQSAQPADRRELFKPAFRHLVSLIQERVKYPAGFEKWQKDDRADFKDMRYAVADTLCDAARKIVGRLSPASILAWSGLTSATAAASSLWSVCTMFCSDCRGKCLHPVDCTEVAAQSTSWQELTVSFALGSQLQAAGLVSPVKACSLLQVSGATVFAGHIWSLAGRGPAYGLAQDPLMCRIGFDKGVTECSYAWRE